MRFISALFLAVAGLALGTDAFAQPNAQPKMSAADSEFVSGVGNLKLMKFAEAEAAFRRVVEIEPGELRGYVGVVQSFMAQKKADEAIAYLSAESAKQPLRMDLHVVTGDTAARAGQYDLALKEFRMVLAQLDPKAESPIEVARGAPGATLNLAPDPNPVAESLRILTLKDLTPKGAAGLHLRMAEVYRAKQDHVSAVSEWQKVSEALPKTAWVLANLGMEQDSGGKRAEAIKSYRETLELMPGNALVLNNIAFLISDTGGDLQEAQRFAHRAASLAPGNVEIMDTEGWIALKLGYVDDAMGTFARLVLRQPARVEFRKHLALALVEKKVPRTPEFDELIKALNAPKADGDETKVLGLLKPFLQ